MRSKTGKNKPSYSQAVRIGLSIIARTHVPQSPYERRAIAWIIESQKHHMTVVQPRAHEEHLKRAKKP